MHGQLEDPKTLTHHKLIHAATERVLSDTKSVADENLKEKGKYHPVLVLWNDSDLSPFKSPFLSITDVLLLIKKRPPPTLPKMGDVSSEEKVRFIN